MKKDIEQYLRDNAPGIPDEGQFLIETNARLRNVEGIKQTVDTERRRGRSILIITLVAGLVLGCLATLLVLFYPARSAADSSAFIQALEALRAGRELLFGGIALLSIALGVVSLGKKRQTL